MNYSREQKENLIWQQTHSDYRGSLGADKSIMLNANHGGGLQALCTFDDKMLAEYFDRAIDRLDRDKSKKVATVLFAKYNMTSKVCEGTINQWCGDKDGIVELIGSVNSFNKEMKKAMLSDLEQMLSPNDSAEMSI
jgi:hypothetical protein